jgi:uncharacterized protein (TIGR02246 family)
MRRKNQVGNFLATLIAIAASALAVSAQQPATQGTAAGDEAAIRENVKQMQDGWNTKSGALFAKPFAADADYVVINGMQIKGREAIGKGHQQIFDTIFKDSTLSLSVEQIRVLRPDVAVAHVAGHNKVRQGEKTSESDAVITLVLTKDQGEWKIAAFQNTQVVSNQRR